MTDTVVHSTEGVDSFDNVTPVELPSSGGDSGSAPEGLDTFDSTEIKTLEDSSDQGDGDEKEIKRETDKLDVQEKEEEEESEDEESDDESGDDKSDEEEESDREETPGDKPRGKTIRVKDGDEKLDISEDADIPVKIKGRKEFVSLKELRDNYSGHRAWSDEMSQVKAKSQEYEEKFENLQSERQGMVDHFTKIGEMIHSGFEDPESDPLAAMKYLVDLSGQNVLEFEKRMLEHYGSIAGSFSQMSEAEQNLYWTQRENQILKDSQAAKAKESEARTAQEQRQQKISQVMVEHGISEEDFEVAKSEISEAGYDLNNVTPEQVCKWSACKPLLEEASELVSQFSDDLDDNQMDALVSGTVDTMYKIQDITALQALQITAQKMGFDVYEEDSVVENLKNRHRGGEDKLKSEGKAKYASKHSESRGYESFDDFEDEQYG